MAAENDAPERIWIAPYDAEWRTTQFHDGDGIEYVRADLAAPDAAQLLSAYNQGVADAKAAIRSVGTNDWGGAEFKPYFINEIARTCSPHRYVASLDAAAIRAEGEKGEGNE